MKTESDNVTELLAAMPFPGRLITQTGQHLDGTLSNPTPNVILLETAAAAGDGHASWVIDIDGVNAIGRAI